MSVCSRIVVFCLIITFVVIISARNITDCMGQQQQQQSQIYINNSHSNCSYGLIRCNGTESQYCFAQGNCSEGYNCEANNSANNSSTTTTVGINNLNTTTSSTMPPHKSDVRQKCTKGITEKFAYPQNCNYYYQCFDGYLLVQQCPFGYAYDSKKSACTEFFADVKCKNISK